MCQRWGTLNREVIQLLGVPLCALQLPLQVHKQKSTTVRLVDYFLCSQLCMYFLSCVSPCFPAKDRWAGQVDPVSFVLLWMLEIDTLMQMMIGGVPSSQQANNATNCANVQPSSQMLMINYINMWKTYKHGWVNFLLLNSEMTAVVVFGKNGKWGIVFEAEALKKTLFSQSVNLGGI